MAKRYMCIIEFKDDDPEDFPHVFGIFPDWEFAIKSLKKTLLRELREDYASVGIMGYDFFQGSAKRLDEAIKKWKAELTSKHTTAGLSWDGSSYYLSVGSLYQKGDKDL